LLFAQERLFMLSFENTNFSKNRFKKNIAIY